MRRVNRPNTGWAFQRVTTHPGEVLLEEFLSRSGLASISSRWTYTSRQRALGRSAHGRRAITPETSFWSGSSSRDKP